MRSIALCCVTLLACAHAKPPEEAAVQKQPEPVAQPAPPPAVEKPAPAPKQAETVAKQYVPVVDANLYFAFDKSDLTSQARNDLQTIAEKAKSGARIRIEGNCDERGTSEYNIGLGQRRADAAKKYLVNLGVPAESILTISYGKERPKALGHDAESWRENRRDDLFVQPSAVSLRTP
jgi:peptidoglycan-associated lipoprotein